MEPCKFYFRFIIFILSIIFLFQIKTSAQEKLFIPRDIQKAYNNGTRSVDGKPGPNYWQNSSDYKITASVDPKTEILSGNETITYHNNSPDTLKVIVIRLYQNLNKCGAERDFPMLNDLITDGVTIEKLAVDNKELDVDTSRFVNSRGTNLFIRMVPAVLPKTSVKLQFAWHFKIPGENNPRMGAYDSTSYLIGYWYPQVSVFDDIDGWDTYDYTGIQEFYNDFCNYDVNITVPNKFGVWATGILQNPDDVLQTDYLEKYKKAHSSDEIIHIVTVDDIKKGNIFSNKSLENTWHYKAENVTDFTFGTSDHYLWDAVGLTVDKKISRRTYIAAVYKKESKDFYGVDDIARKSIEYYSYTLPGIPFPYPSLTVFNGGGGMEFPMMVNDGSFKDVAATVHVTSHEISHEYFPFYMGIDETKYAFMDEGMATFIPYELQAELASGYHPEETDALRYSKFAGTEMDMPMMIPSTLLKGSSYRQASYIRPGLVYYILRNYVLDKETFDKVFREYIKRWHGKHPIPYDFFNTFNVLSNKNLDWFWKPWFFDRGFPDLAIKSAINKGNKIEVTISRIGEFPLPVYLKIFLKNGKAVSIYKNADIWSKGQKELKLSKKLESPAEKVELGNSHIPDVNRENNAYNIH
jgi:Peptidase family M1 domain